MAWGAACRWLHHPILINRWLLSRLTEIILLLLPKISLELRLLLLHHGASNWWWLNCLRWWCIYYSLLAVVWQDWGLDLLHGNGRFDWHSRAGCTWLARLSLGCRSWLGSLSLNGLCCSSFLLRTVIRSLLIVAEIGN